MNIIVATSRGVGLADRLADINTKVYVHPGGKLSEMTDKIVKSLTPPGSPSTKTHIYFVSGIPDITTRIQEHPYHQEIVYTENPIDTFNRIKAGIINANNKILSAGAIPIFCTIPSTKILKYNNFRLQKRRTNRLYYKDNYSIMQRKLESALDLINEEITAINVANDMSTPYLHVIIKKGTGTKEDRKYTYYYNKLYDGVHATDKTKKSWATTIRQAIKKNRPTLEEEEEEISSPKRSWRSERFLGGARLGNILSW